MKELTRRRFAVGWAPRRPLWWLIMAFLAVGLPLFAVAIWPGVSAWPVAAFMGGILSVPLAVVWLVALRLPQLWARIARSGALVASLWGAGVATGIFALQANGAIMLTLGQQVGTTFAQSWGAAIAAPLTEETGKVLAVVAVLLASGQRLRTPMDGAMLGAFSGLGFMVAEDVLYCLNIANLTLGENQWISSMVIYLVRTVMFGMVSHALMSATVGAGLGYLMVGRAANGTRMRRIGLGLALMALGYTLHFTWNSPLPVWARFAYQVAVPLLLWWVLWGLRRAEHRWFRATLAAPGALGAIEPWWVDTVAHSWRARRRYRARVVATYGPGYKALQRLAEARLSDLADAVAVGDEDAAAQLRATLWAQLHPQGEVAQAPATVNNGAMTMTMPEDLPQDTPLDPAWLDRIVSVALYEDLGVAPGRDVTTQATIAVDSWVTGDVVMREAGVVCALAAVDATVAQVAAQWGLPPARVTHFVRDGDAVAAGTVVARVEGPGHVVLVAERTILNIMSRASGVATHTRRWVDALQGTSARVLDTRKTTPGLRAVEKYAVRCGGGINKRMGLFDCAMVKDNHIVAAGSVTAAIQAIATRFPGVPIQVEVETPAQADEALAAGIRYLMVDNMPPAQMADLVRSVRAREGVLGPVRIEATGGLTLATVREVALSGVDFMSVGALTHSSPILDIALDLR